MAINRWLFRAVGVRGIDSVLCKNSKSTKDEAYHIKYATSQETRFVSATQSAIVAETYRFDLSETQNQIGCPVILIDTSKISDESSVNIDGEKYPVKMIDIEELELKGQSAYYSGAAKEVLFEYGIPQDAYKEIPPLVFDILCALEDSASGSLRAKDSTKIDYSYSGVEKEEAFGFLKDVLCQAVMTGKINYIIDQIINDAFNHEFVKLDPISVAFMTRYYGLSGERETMQDICKDLLGESDQSLLIGRALKGNIVKKMTFYLCDYMDELRFLDDKEIEDEYMKKLKKQIQEIDNKKMEYTNESLNFFGRILNNECHDCNVVKEYIPLPEACMLHKSPERKFSTTAKTRYERYESSNSNTLSEIQYGWNVLETGNNLLAPTDYKLKDGKVEIWVVETSKEEKGLYSSKCIYEIPPKTKEFIEACERLNGYQIQDTYTQFWGQSQELAGQQEQDNLVNNELKNSAHNVDNQTDTILKINKAMESFEQGLVEEKGQNQIDTELT